MYPRVTVPTPSRIAKMATYSTPYCGYFVTLLPAPWSLLLRVASGCCSMAAPPPRDSAPLDAGPGGESSEQVVNPLTCTLSQESGC